MDWVNCYIISKIFVHLFALRSRRQQVMGLKQISAMLIAVFDGHRANATLWTVRYRIALMAAS